MPARSYKGKVVYYGGYPGSSGKPVPGRLRWRNGVLSFEPRGRDAGPSLRFEQARLLGVRRSEEGLLGARRIRLLIDVATERGDKATLKFEMRGFVVKERKLAAWLDVLGPACKHHEDESNV